MLLLLSCDQVKDDQFLGVVSSATPEASRVGEMIFKKGGNAVDVAIAVSFALGVTEPAMSGLGGGTQVLLSIKNEPPVAINGTTFSPDELPEITRDTLTYHRRTTIPSTVKVLDYLYNNYGSGNLTWEELISPSIALAKNGFTIGSFRAKVYKKYEEKLVNSTHNTSFFLLKGSEIPAEGQVLKQPILAKTLTRLATKGADDFYHGEIAKDIVEDMKENGGWITQEDLNNFKYPKELEPLSINHNGSQVYSQPPPCGGWTSLLILNILKHNGSAESISLSQLVEALYLGQNDRRNKPITNLKEYRDSTEIKLADVYALQLLNKLNTIKDKITGDERSGETTHFSVIDAEGTAISVTASINAYFGALAASKRLGFLYNTYMDDFVFDNKQHPFAIKPGAMAYSSMSPTIVQKNGKNSLIIGSPGSSRIISTVAQLTAAWINNEPIEKLIHVNRVHVNRDNLYLEKASDTLLLDQEMLNKYNLTIKFPDKGLMNENLLNPYFGGVHAIARENGKWIGVADPRRDGTSLYVTTN